MLLLAFLLAAIATVAPAPMRVAAAAPQTLYVDGKHGNDGNSGASWQAAFKTIYEAARRVPRGTTGAGWRVVVRGYSDYLYRGRPMPGGWNRSGVAGSPIVFEAEGWSPGANDYVRPIVSGGLKAPSAGKSWARASAGGVWYTPWSIKPNNFVGASSAYDTAIFQNGTTWLWQRPSLGDLGRTPKAGGFWYDAAAKRLYVAPKGGGNPNGMSVEVPHHSGFFFSGDHGGSWVEVRGFEIRHANMGIAFVNGVDHSMAVDNVAVANNHLGFHSAGRNLSSGFDPAVGNVFLRNSGAYNTVQAFKIDAGSQDTVVCDNTAARNALQGIKVQGPLSSRDHRVTRDIEVCRNLIHHQTFWRPDAISANATGLTVSNGARTVNVHHNDVWANSNGIHVTQQGTYGLPMPGLRISRNRIWANTRFGADFRDGSPSPSGGSGSMTSRYNLWWGNGVGILVDAYSTNKTFSHDTIFDNHTMGMIVGPGGEAIIKSSLITHNGRWGLQVQPRGRVSISHTGLPSNASGAISGTASRKAINTSPAGYMTLDSSHASFLRIKAGSYQYTAGPSGTPIGARY